MLGVERLTKRYGALTAVRDLSFEARPGERPLPDAVRLLERMRQKILIAAAVLHDPRVVILDEPFSGLDVSAARVLKAFVRALADSRKIVVFSSHVLEVVEQVCSRVVILRDGVIVGHDSVANLRSTLQLPSLDAVFAALVADDNIDERTRGLVGAMTSGNMIHSW